jgi:hypothetical protein
MIGIFWVVVALVLQGLVLWIVGDFVHTLKQMPPEPFDPVGSAFLILIDLAWFELVALRFWGARPRRTN